MSIGAKSELETVQYRHPVSREIITITRPAETFAEIMAAKHGPTLPRAEGTPRRSPRQTRYRNSF